MSPLIEREAAALIALDTRAKPENDNNGWFKLRSLIAKRIRALPTVVPVADVERAARKFLDVICGATIGDDEDVTPYVRAILDAGVVGSVRLEDLSWAVTELQDLMEEVGVTPSVWTTHQRETIRRLLTAVGKETPRVD